MTKVTKNKGVYKGSEHVYVVKSSTIVHFEKEKFELGIQFSSCLLELQIISRTIRDHMILLWERIYN